MACYYPVKGWKTLATTELGKRTFTQNRVKALITSPLTVPCTRCIGCKLEHSRQWAMRCVHEAQLHEHNSFLTLTYNEEHLPHDRSLDPEHLRNFWYKLRAYIRRTERTEYKDLLQRNKNLPPLVHKKIRYYACGEYGKEQDKDNPNHLGRPHYHAILFNHHFKDNTIVGRNSNGDYRYTSVTLDKIWGKGTCEIGSVSFESAGYTARYCTQKITGELATDHYKKINTDTGEQYTVEREFSRQSTSRGIGYEWWKKYNSDLNKDFITIRGIRMKPAKYYDNQLEKLNEEIYKRNKKIRKKTALNNRADNTPERLAVKEYIKKHKTKSLKRQNL